MKYAVFTVSTPEYTPEEVFGVLRELGYDGVEWRVVDQDPLVGGGEPGYWQGNRCTLPLRTFVEDAPRIRALTRQVGLETTNVGAYASCDKPVTLLGGATGRRPSTGRRRDLRGLRRRRR